MNHRFHLPVCLLVVAFAFSTTWADAPDSEPLDLEKVLDHAPDVPKRAVLRYAETDLEEWHYVRTRESDEGVIVDRHDPTLPGEEHWQLVTIDGREPTESEREDYEEDRADHSDREERARGEELVQVLLPGSIQFLGEENGVQRYSYALRSPDGKRERVYEALEGEMLIEPDAEAPWVREVRVWNRDTIRPWLGVRIDEASLSFSFTIKDDWVLPASVDAHWAGEFLLLRDIGNTIRFRLDDFRHVNEPTNDSWSSAP